MQPGCICDAAKCLQPSLQKWKWCARLVLRVLEWKFWWNRKVSMFENRKLLIFELLITRSCFHGRDMLWLYHVVGFHLFFCEAWYYMVKYGQALAVWKDFCNIEFTVPGFQMSSDQNPGWLGYIRDYTTQFYKDYSNAIIRIPINQSV